MDEPRTLDEGEDGVGVWCVGVGFDVEPSSILLNQGHHRKPHQEPYLPVINALPFLTINNNQIKNSSLA